MSLGPVTTSVSTSANIPARTLLEAAELPFRDLVRLAAREGRRPRPIYQIHKWFARRLGCTVRTLLIGAVHAPTADFWAAYYDDADLSGLTVLDPFVGGGTSVVEASRLGASATGVDVDPIACAIASAEVDAASMPDLLPALQKLQQVVGARMAPFYRTTSPAGLDLTVLHHFWVQVVECEECGTPNEAHPSYLLGDAEVGGRWAFCKACHEVRQLRRGQQRFVCLSCDATTDLTSPPVDNGTLSCSKCSHESRLIDVGRAGSSPPAWRLFAVEARDRTSAHVPITARLFRRATRRDQGQFDRAKRLLSALRTSRALRLPSATIVAKGRSDSRLIDYGYRRWIDLFNERQLLHLGLLAAEIRCLPDRLRVPLGLAFSNHLTTNCMMTAYAVGWRRLTPLFSVRAFRHVPRPVELNPWTDGTGRGSFPNAVRQVTRASQYARSPREPGRRRQVFRNVAPVAPEARPRIVAGNARDLAFIASDSIDMVLTDPPYFDNVEYSELADFFQPWLEDLGLVPSEETRRALVGGALRARRNSPDRAAVFAQQLGEAFCEARRVLRPSGLLAFTFRHSTAMGWYAMACALASAGLRPVQVLPLPGEAGVGLHIESGTTLWDAVLVFRKLAAPPAADTLSKTLLRAARASADGWRDRFSRQEHVPFNDGDHVNLLRALLVAASLGLFGVSRGPGESLESALEKAATA